MNTIKWRNIIITLFLVAFSSSLYAQDLIVTDEGDSLNCKITRIKENNIYFTFLYNGQIRSTMIPEKQVPHYQYDYYPASFAPALKIKGSEIYPHIRAAINGGLSYRIAKLEDGMPSDFKRYSRELKSGYHYGIDLSYFISEQLGLGFKYYNYRSQNSISDIYVTYLDGSSQYGTMSDNISISFIGPFISARALDRYKKNGLILNVGIGYMGYRDNATLITDYTLKSSAWGVCYDVGYDIGISKHFAIGLQLSILTGILREYELSDGTHTETIKLDKDNYESLARIDLSIGLRFTR